MGMKKQPILGLAVFFFAFFLFDKSNGEDRCGGQQCSACQAEKDDAQRFQRRHGLGMQIAADGAGLLPSSGAVQQRPLDQLRLAEAVILALAAGLTNGAKAVVSAGFPFPVLRPYVGGYIGDLTAQ